LKEVPEIVEVYFPHGKIKNRMSVKLLLLWLIVLAALSLTSCTPNGTAQVKRGFYYWKSNFALRPSDRDVLTKLDVNYLYVKFFDVTWKNGPAPVATVKFSTRPPTAIRVIPTVFITNDTLKKLSPNAVTDLARKISGKIRRIGDQNNLAKFTEIQIDCDWTDSTRQKYFVLLQQLKKEWGDAKICISATIRLHQIKYCQRTGVPPVDRGVLMFYNMGDVTDFDTQNSILDLDIAKQYTGTLHEYPLGLDLALPLFSWGVVFQDKRFIGLASDFHLSEMKRKPFKPYREHIFRVGANVYLHDTQLYQGDLVRIEESTYLECRKSAAFLKRKLNLNSQSRVLFFHYDPTDIGVMGIGQVEQVYRTFN
jgi:hypothetical protein